MDVWSAPRAVRNVNEFGAYGELALQAATSLNTSVFNNLIIISNQLKYQEYCAILSDMIVKWFAVK
jgi:hypothetical protein